jgi:hypothetical protein
MVHQISCKDFSKLRCYNYGAVIYCPRNLKGGSGISNIVATTYPVYNQKLAGFLMLQGYVLMGMGENKKYQGKNVFYFVESDKLKHSIKTYFGKA